MAAVNHYERKCDRNKRQYPAADILHAQPEEQAVYIQCGGIRDIQRHVPDQDANRAGDANKHQPMNLTDPRPDRGENRHRQNHRADDEQQKLSNRNDRRPLITD